ncbi:hypothetical protein H0E87_029053 [Populus deltoides]|uniref:Uncharacterized protein n=1 Tax=Populus deltoides TaxID=3696 RepID=A0A8T2WJC1_POPDE|nr:hypothetical protein H0E87_029053 [Populus deltoides]
MAGEPFLGAVLTEREGLLAEGENGGLLMRGRGCWRLGGSVTEISKTREAAGGWLKLEDEGMKKRWKGRGAVAKMEKWRGSLVADLGEEDGGMVCLVGKEKGECRGSERGCWMEKRSMWWLSCG